MNATPPPRSASPSIPADGADLQTLLKNADTAMYLAKERGQERLPVLLPRDQRPSIERLTLETNLRHALERERVRCCTTSRRSTSTNGEVTGVEALLRWQHPERGMLPPASSFRSRRKPA